MMKRLAVLALALGVVLVYAKVRAEQSTFVVDGSAEIKDNNFAKAKTDALNDAYKKALTQSLTQILGEKAMQEKKSLIDDHFFQDPSKFVNRYHIETEGFEGDVYNVNVTIDLLIDKIRIELVQAGLDRSRSQSLILAVVEEENDSYKSGWLISKPVQSQAEKLLALEIQRWGYRLVKPDSVIDPQKLDKYIADKPWLSQLGERRNARYLVLGEEQLATEKKEAPAGQKGQIKTTEEAATGVYTVTATLAINVFDLDHGEKQQLAKIEQSASDNDLAEARSKATELAIRQALPDISLALEKLSRKGQPEEKGQKVIAEVMGVNSYFQYQQLMSGLKEIDSLKSVDLWGFSPGIVKVSIQAPGDRETIKRQVAAHHFGEFKLLPVESEKTELRFELEPIR